jgi:glutamate-ammonia-ligase adenylyltransferase
VADAKDTATNSLTALAKFGFVELSDSLAKLDQLVSLVGDPGRTVLASLAKCADPDQALNALIDFATADKARVKKLLAKSDGADRFCLVLGASSAMIEFLARSPKSFEIFLASPKLPSLEEMRKKFGEALAAKAGVSLDEANGKQVLWDSLRLCYREILLQIAIFDLSASDGIAVVPQVSAALADAAGAALDAGLVVGRRELTESIEFGRFTLAEVAATKLSVIGMGKGGARELNYISDVDVIFVAESGNEQVENSRALEIATKLATRMMRAMDANSTEPALWQVDANLRPEGKSGALVRTLESHIAYYDRWAESWEFQALLKARPIAGDLKLGAAYVDALTPKIWQSTKRENFVESVQRMRERVTENIPADEIDRQIKLGPGGLRDIEFTVQLLQLVHGRTDESVRQRDTVSAIAALATGSYIGRAEAAQFSQHYRWLRFVEHRIQFSQMRRTHMMPTSAAAQRAIARSIDTKLTADDLLAKWEEVKLEVRSLHQKLFYRPLLSAVAKLDDSNLKLSDDQAIDRLSAIGFIDPKAALGHISALTSGLSRRAQIQRSLLPVLLQWFADGTDPDSALMAFRRLSEDLGESHWYLRMLRDSSGAAARLAKALSNSRLATSLLELIPESAAWFENPAELAPLPHSVLAEQISALSLRHESIEDFAKAVRHIRRRETLRLALGAVVADLTLEQINRGLSDVTAVYLEAIVSHLLQKLEHNDEPMASLLDFGVVAMGRFGGEELGFGSDADLMYVYEPMAGVSVAVAQKAAEKLIAEIKRCTTDQQLEFDIDLGLRPEGKNGPVARSLESYRVYYSRWGNIWENQALLRARIFTGSKSLQAEFTKMVDELRYPEILEERSVIEIRRIKARVETERLPQGADPKRHLKLGRGSLSDVEWLVQLIQLQHGAEHPSIRTPKTLDALEAIVATKLMAEHDARVLREAWLLASRVRSASVLWANKRSDVLTTDRRQLDGMAGILEYGANSASQLEQDYLSVTRRARMVFDRLFYGVSAQSSD